MLIKNYEDDDDDGTFMMRYVIQLSDLQQSKG